MLSCKRQDLSQPTSTDCILIGNINTNYSKANAIKWLIDKYTKEGLPGIAVGVYSKAEGWWTSASGFAKIEEQTPMRACHLQYLQSISKTYMAVAMLKLREQGKIELDKAITTYLPTTYSTHIEDASKITVRMLLNHTSGIPDYIEAGGYAAYLLQHPTHVFSSKEFLQFIDKKPLEFDPGYKYQYCNTNYLLLALIADAVVGDHASYIQQHILDPLNLTHTFYRNKENYTQNPDLVNSYWDRFGNSSIENITQMQKANVASMAGDDGMVTTPTDVIQFLKGLVEGKLLNPASLQLMQTWVNNDKGKPIYGMGLFHYEHKGVMLIGHGGAGIGAGAALVYIPSLDTYLFMGANIGTSTDGPLTTKAEQLREDLLDIIL
jgi:D-alanyl-D-alanine carboxypeptidase